MDTVSSEMNTVAQIQTLDETTFPLEKVRIQSFSSSYG